MLYAEKVFRAVQHLNNLYGRGDVKECRLYGNGKIEFTVQGYMMNRERRRGHLYGETVHVLGHQLTIGGATWNRCKLAS